MKRSLRPLSEIVELNRDLVVNCLRDLPDEAARSRVVPDANSVAFLVAHLADARYFLASMLGRPIDNPLSATLGDVSSIDDAPELPAVSELLDIWLRVSDHLSECLRAAPYKTLTAEADQPFPVSDPSVLGGVAFLLQHESYHVGQLGLLRKALGFDPMSYERAERG